ncbi:hypothetical protein ANCCEY_10056 [Ancylostoma ceylanicum]|uniref:Peptidase C1A papain C-terminal domain-containing protein n=1 Tax=Ancylostoma ceylanicum TaxID=53326 RepID=A0A0D6LFL8_9BILA|nr:hypothetical protein ANCCEY_10056 [Ancylostoma ceylanicum]
MKHIRDQSSCGSCWAVAAASAMSDRVCALTNGRINDACQPYAFYPCGNHAHEPYYGPCPDELWPTPTCRRTCQLGYPIPFEKDKIFSELAFYKISDLPNT